jgi:molybdopterin molybdotransferase
MISYAEAQTMVRGKARSFGTEVIPLDRADARVLTGVVRADRDYPPFNRATMDGYALRWESLQKGGRQFRVVETIFAGTVATQDLPADACYKIMTGAPVPDGTDVIIRREDVIEEGGMVRLRSDVGRPFLNIARRGEDLRGGDIVIDSPCICEPPIIGLLASLGQNELTVASLPRVALITTGDEVVPVDTPPGPAQIRNSNRWLLQSLLKKWQIEPWFYGHAPDDKMSLKVMLGEALKAEIIILCGGVSAGDADYVPEMLEASGAACLFHKLAIKPGKPVWCGITAAGAMVFALPGNPFSCLVGFILLIQPYLQACFGLPAPVPMTLPLASLKKKKTPLDEFFPVRLHGAPARLHEMTLNGSGDIRLGMQAGALALHPASEGDLPGGAEVVIFPFPW